MIELLAVFGIMAIIGTMSVGKISTWMNKSRLERAAQTLSQDLGSAFSLAVRNNTPIVVSFQRWSPGDSIRLRLASRGGTVYRTRHFGINSAFGLRTSEITQSDTTFEIYPMGLAQNGDTITITRNGISRRIIMSRAGVVTVNK